MSEILVSARAASLSLLQSTSNGSMRDGKMRGSISYVPDIYCLTSMLLLFNLPVDAVRAVDHDDGGGDDHDGRVDDHVVPVVVGRAHPKLSRLQNGNKYVFGSAPEVPVKFSCCCILVWILRHTSKKLNINRGERDFEPSNRNLS